MYADADGGPLVHPSAKGLGVRRNYDIFPDENGNVEPDGKHGMTVRPSIEDIPRDFQEGRWIVWEIDIDALGPSLHYVQDAEDHGVFEPARTMSFEDYEDAIIGTRANWRRGAG